MLLFMLLNFVCIGTYFISYTAKYTHDENSLNWKRIESQRMSDGGKGRGTKVARTFGGVMKNDQGRESREIEEKTEVNGEMV